MITLETDDRATFIMNVFRQGNCVRIPCFKLLQTRQKAIGWQENVTCLYVLLSDQSESRVGSKDSAPYHNGRTHIAMRLVIFSWEALYSHAAGGIAAQCDRTAGGLGPPRPRMALGRTSSLFMGLTPQLHVLPAWI